MGERITGVALCFSDNPSDCLSDDAPARHHDLIRLACRIGYERDKVLAATQGFVTSAGRFVTREEALPIARSAGQIARKTEPADQLFSEDLW